VAVSEFDLIYRYLAAYGAGDHVLLGVGDDAAVLAVPPGCQLLVSTDTQVEGRHFLGETLPEHIAYRAVAAAASDLAAMAATPCAMTLALTLPDSDELWLHSFSQGLARSVKDLGLPLVGGDLTRGPLTVTVTVMGFAPNGEWLPRSGAQAGDLLCVSGTVGDAAAGLALLQGQLLTGYSMEDARSTMPNAVDASIEDSTECSSECSTECDGLSVLTIEQGQYLEDRFFYPSPRFELVDWMRRHAHAAIDVSDGLLADAGHMAAASGLGCIIQAADVPLSPALRSLPRPQAFAWALTGGDDYELLIAVAPGTELPPMITPVGIFVPEPGIRCEGFDVERSGFDHFGSGV